MRVSDLIIAACHCAAVVATGPRDVPDQNSAPRVLGTFSGALDSRVQGITSDMCFAFAQTADVSRLSWQGTHA